MQTIGIICHCFLHCLLQNLKALMVPHTGHSYKYFLIWCLVGNPSSFNIWKTRCRETLTFWPISDIVINKLEIRSSLMRFRTSDLDKEAFVLVITAILYSLFVLKQSCILIMAVSYTRKYYTWLKECYVPPKMHGIKSEGFGKWKSRLEATFESPVISRQTETFKIKRAPSSLCPTKNTRVNIWLRPMGVR